MLELHVTLPVGIWSRPALNLSHAHQEGGLKSVVEYHREEKMKIQEQLEALERERELIQCDLNNARSKGRCAIGVGT